MEPMEHHLLRRSPASARSATTPESTPWSVQPRRRVLVVDDDPLIRKLVTRFLDRSGYEVIQAENGREAWRLFRQAPCDLVVTDLVMPVMDGTALTARIKAMNRDTPVVVITGQGREAVRDMAGPAGQAEAVLGKPFDLDTLARVVAALLCDRSAASAVTITLKGEGDR
jgi:CheY-like chemotaxis protein